MPRGTETILLAEDEPGVRAVVRLVLESSGYTVLEAKAAKRRCKSADSIRRRSTCS